MQKGSIEYIKCGNYETEIEKFWLEIKTDVLSTLEDKTVFDFKLNRQFVGAVSGEFAGILIEVILSLPECTLATIAIWEKISKHFKATREVDRLPRLLNMKILENLCRFELMQNDIKNFELIKAKKLIQENEPDEDFNYVDDAYKCKVAKFVFKSKKYKFTFIIDNDGEITDYKKTKNN
ncbi:MAG: hypothetical protein ABJQ39_00450 [Winogradskyella arenosi]